MNIPNLIEKRVDTQLDKMIGDKDEELKTITKMAILKEDIDKNEILEIINRIKSNHEQEVKYYLEEMTMTLDSGGNVVPIN